MIAISSQPSAGTIRDYSVYGFRVRSDAPLIVPECPDSGRADIELLSADACAFTDILADADVDPSEWLRCHELRGGWGYLRCAGCFEFLISPDGGRVLYRLLGDVTTESLQAYLLGRVFSYALVKRGYEPLHASAVVVDGQAVAFLGLSAFGKSSLAASFVAAGHPLLTDDVLCVKDERGRLIAFPGPPRLKLFPKLARRFLKSAASRGTLNPRSEKGVFVLTSADACSDPVPLAVIYVLETPGKASPQPAVRVAHQSASTALLDLLRYTHNHCVVDAARLARQFKAATLIADRVRMRTLVYPRVLSALPVVRETVLADLRGSAA